MAGRRLPSTARAPIAKVHHEAAFQSTVNVGSLVLGSHKIDKERLHHDPGGGVLLRPKRKP